MSAYDAPQSLPPEFDRAQALAQQAVFFGGVLAVVSFVTFPTRFFQTYLVGYLYWVGISLGCLGLLLLHYLVGGIWGFLIRRPAQAGALILPRMAFLFLPIALAIIIGLDVYPWAHSETLQHDALIREKSSYLNPVFFLGRTVGYFVLWIVLTNVLTRGMREQDETKDPSPTYRLQTVSGPGLVAFFISMTFAMMDWGMTLEPEWFSTIYGVMLFVGAVLATLSVLAIVTSRLRHLKPLTEVAVPQAFHDIGNLMLAFTMLWAYISFSQYLITYSGNLTEEIPFYLHRSVGGWRLIAGLLIFFQFFLPFFLLLGRDNKRTPDVLAKIAFWILVMHLMDILWLVVPAYQEKHALSTFWLMLKGISSLAGVGGSFLLVGGLWVSAFLRELRSRSLLPNHNDPLLLEVFEHMPAAHEGGH